MANKCKQYSTALVCNVSFIHLSVISHLPSFLSIYLFIMTLFSVAWSFFFQFYKKTSFSSDNFLSHTNRNLTLESMNEYDEVPIIASNHQCSIICERKRHFCLELANRFVKNDYDKPSLVWFIMDIFLLMYL